MAANISTPTLYDHDKDLPILECGRRERYTVSKRRSEHSSQGSSAGDEM